MALLAAAAREFRERGYSAASLDAIAERAGYSKGVVYSRFASKADLFLALLEQRIEDRARRNVEYMRVALADDDPMGSFMRQLRADPNALAWRLALLEFQLVAARDPELRRRYAELHLRTLEGIAHITQRFVSHLGTDIGIDPITLARAMFALDNGMAIEMLVTPDAFSLDEQAELIRRLLTPVGRPVPPTASDTAQPAKEVVR